MDKTQSLLTSVYYDVMRKAGLRLLLLLKLFHRFNSSPAIDVDPTRSNTDTIKNQPCQAVYARIRKNRTKITMIATPQSKPHEMYCNPLRDYNARERDTLVSVAHANSTEGVADTTGTTIRDILADAYCEDLERSWVYQTLDSLERDGLVDKQPADGRSNQYALTDEGAAKIKEYHESWTSIMEGAQ